MNKDPVENLPDIKPQPIRFASFLADNAFEFYRQVVAYLGEVTGLPTELVSDLPPAGQDRLVDTGQVQAVFICGLPYVRKADRTPSLLRLMAAPVLAAWRYQDRPIYFSDVIVRAGSPYQKFADLRGKLFAYNETHSWSGYVLVCHHLNAIGESEKFFGAMRPSGAHAVSMDWVAAGRVDAAAIDSVVLAMEASQHPERIKALRVIEQMGPSPMPPVAASTGLAEPLFQSLRQTLLEMHTDRRGQAILEQAGVRRFAAVTDHDYDPIRRVIQEMGD